MKEIKAEINNSILLFSHFTFLKLCGYIEATSQDISQEVKAWSQMGLPNGQ